MIKLSRIQTILVDPQAQANAWIKEKYISQGDELGLLVLSQHNNKFARLLATAVRYGKSALVENVGQDIDRALLPFFNKEMIEQGIDGPTITLGGVKTLIHPNFKLYVTSELSKPRFSPDFTVHSNIINFALSQQSLEAQLLGMYVAEKMGKLEDKFNDLKKKALECIVKLQEVENLIMAGLNNDVEIVLRDEKLIENLAQSNL